MLTKQSIKTLIANSLISYFTIVTDKIETDIATHNAVMASSAGPGHMSTAHYNKLEGIETGADVNQDAISNITVGDVTVSAGNPTDTVTIVQGDHMSVTANAGNKTITIAGAYGEVSKTEAGLAPMIPSDETNIYLCSDGWHAIQSATTGLAGIVQLSDATDSTSVTQAATANSVKLALEAAKTYADGVKDAIIGGADGAWDTLKEIQDTLTNDGSVIGAINDSIAGKADANHTHTGAELAIGTYNVPASYTAIDAADTISVALGKVEKKMDTLEAGGAAKWTNERTITVTGGITGSVALDGSKDVTLATTLSNLASNKVTAMTGYVVGTDKVSPKATSNTAIAVGDSLNKAIGKLEAGLKGLALSDLFDTDVTGATLDGYGIDTLVYTTEQGTALAGRVTTLENNFTSVGGVETIGATDVTDIINAVNDGLGISIN